MGESLESKFGFLVFQADAEDLKIPLNFLSCRKYLDCARSALGSRLERPPPIVIPGNYRNKAFYLKDIYTFGSICMSKNNRRQISAVSQPPSPVLTDRLL